MDGPRGNTIKRLENNDVKIVKTVLATAVSSVHM